ncbi:CehA/McbA family metallohydrolase [Rubinisphaera italica]|uniref:Uncharacterized protein n=1 Tax=Rubinisphaera italica TaxID=2527969 RepID=A0A5C5XD27_9PLAN|nr:CehA/McbA family metallohydrolase [Rubinisphaera italica]TWT60213.1 hypothetical protein Pan54_09270 [Rubinisphaera italica]
MRYYLGCSKHWLTSIVGLIILLNALPLFSDEGVSVTRITAENWKTLVPGGKEIDAIYGDLILKNRHVTAVIAQPLATRNANMTVREVAGCLIDYTTTQSPNDQLSAYYPGSRVYPFRSWTIINSDQEAVELDNQSTYSDEDAIEIQVTADSAENRAELVVCYRLEADSQFLQVQHIFSNPGKADVEVSLSDDLRFDSGKEDAHKSENGRSELLHLDDRYWGQAYGIASPGRMVTSRSDSRLTVARYGRGSRQADIILKSGEQFRFDVNLYVADNLCTVEAIHAQLNSDRVAIPCTLTVIANGSRLPNARLELTRDNQYAGTLWTDGSGRVDQKLFPGEYRLDVSFCGIPVGDSFTASVSESNSLFDLDVPLKTGTLEIQIDDAANAPLPCKVELIRKGEKTSLDLGPETATTRVKNLLYLVNGRDRILLPAGAYEAIISHGPEFDALFQEVTVEPQKLVRLTGVLKQTVHTPGWVSTEYHSHSSPSGDNTGHQLGRVLNLVCEQLEFAPCTEHNRIDTYEPHLQSLNIADRLATCTGMELTGSPLPLNHQNVFPLIHKPGQQDGGGPVTDVSPETQIQRVALWDNRSEKLVQQNHPDIGWLFYDKNGDGEQDEGFSESFPFIHAMEIHPLASVLKFGKETNSESHVTKNRIFNWLQLLNQGIRITGVVNTDAHYNYHGSGGLRNWVKSSTDDPNLIETMEMVRETKAGHVIMSNGPYLSVSARTNSSDQQFLPGDDMTCPEGKVQLDIQVQCPNWFDIDRVFVLVNGEHVSELDFNRTDQPQMFQDGVIKFDNRVIHQLETDAHLIVVAAGEKSKLGPVQGPGWGSQQPIAISNPIFVDVDSDGFQANGNLLDDGLPVKGD